uniref:ATP synthase F0 subunit 8 n=1 Tax=Lepidozona coreanica TaxID=55527 RepID=A0A6G9DVF0_9MOLL|nr:ATP synthase F0 subunit 8 [Lepidozona coreanica]QIP53381.1 ATP synthase F0 subunit 8 [Lepidozona coreanica]
MPQLAPLNWIFLESFFWTIIIMVTVMFWWNKDKKYIICSINKKSSLISKKWTW